MKHSGDGTRIGIMIPPIWYSFYNICQCYAFSSNYKKQPASAVQDQKTALDYLISILNDFPHWETEFVFTLLGHVYWECGRKSDALKAFQLALRFDPENLLVMRNILHILDINPRGPVRIEYDYDVTFP